MRVYIILILMFCIYSAPVFARDGRLERCEKYRTEVENILKDEGVSIDFFYLMAAESGCRKGAKSSAGARGFWQMMPATARVYGCNDADDLSSATRAAAQYLKKLSRDFDNEKDIIIAYSMGGHNYRKRGATRAARGLYSMFYELREEGEKWRINH